MHETTTLLEGDRKKHIEIALANYPSVDAGTLADLLKYFREEASALDVGLIASDPRLEPRYRLLKSDHLDQFSGKEIFWKTVALMILVAGAALLFALRP